MAPYALLLNGNHYSDFARQCREWVWRSHRCNRSNSPTMGQYYLLICSENAVGQLMDLATRHCRDAVFEISRQLERQKGRVISLPKAQDSSDTERRARRKLANKHKPIDAITAPGTRSIDFGCRQPGSCVWNSYFHGLATAGARSVAVSL